MTRLLCKFWCFLLLIGSALPVDEILCMDRGIGTEGSHAGISSAICHEDGRVDLYVWNLLVDGVYRRQIEYLCYNTSEELGGEHTIPKNINWGGPFQSQSLSFTVESWSPNTTCQLYGCYAIEVTGPPWYQYYLMPSVECSAPAPTSSLAASHSQSVSVYISSPLLMTLVGENGSGNSNFVELAPTSSLAAVLPTSPLHSQSISVYISSSLPKPMSLVEENGSGNRNDSSATTQIYVFVGVAIAIVAVLIVASGVCFLAVKKKKWTKYKLPVVDPNSKVDIGKEIVPATISPDNLSITSDKTLLEILGLIPMERSPLMKHHNLERDAFVTSALEQTDVEEALHEDKQTSEDSVSSLTESGGSVETHSLSETSRRLTGEVGTAGEEEHDASVRPESLSDIAMTFPLSTTTPTCTVDSDYPDDEEESILTFFHLPENPRFVSSRNPGYVVPTDAVTRSADHTYITSV